MRACIIGEHVLLEHISYWRNVFHEDTSYRRIGFTGENVL